MLFFKRPLKPTQKEEKGNSQEAQKIFTVLKEGIEKMKAKQIEHIPIALFESNKTELSIQKTTGWVTVNDKEIQNYLSYYPYEVEVVGVDEKKFIAQEKSYVLQGLILAHGVSLKSGVDGVVQYERSRINWLMLKRVEGTARDYFTELQIGGDDNSFKIFANELVKDGFTSEKVAGKIDSAISEYKTITQRLMEKEGVFQSLKRLEDYPPLAVEGLLAEARKQIDAAKN